MRSYFMVSYQRTETKVDFALEGIRILLTGRGFPSIRPCEKRLYLGRASLQGLKELQGNLDCFNCLYTKSSLADIDHTDN